MYKIIIVDKEVENAEKRLAMAREDFQVALDNLRNAAGQYADALLHRDIQLERLTADD